MIETNRLDYKKDLEEVLYMFSEGNDIDIKHTEKTCGNSFFNEYEIDGEVYKTENVLSFSNELELKRYEKRFSKLELYKLLTKRYGIDFPWGALTGIRPVKMARNEGENFEEVLKNTFIVSDKKIELVKKILKEQEGIYDKGSCYSDFYVSIPFCPTRCVYCSFTSQVASSKEMIDRYTEALCDEITRSIPFSKNCRSVYIGGGTPVVLSYQNLKKVMDALVPVIDVSSEITVEGGRPDAITKEKLDLLKDYGVTRICVNPQSFLDRTLSLIGRKHTVQDIYDKYRLCKGYGFDINMDLIAGLPEETYDDFKFSVDSAVELNPENITIHTLCLKKGAVLKEKTKRLGDKDIYDMIDYSHEKLGISGYSPYYLYRQKYMAGNLENTGYSKPGKQCIYNIDVMEETSDNIACGAGAVSKKVNLPEEKIERYGAPKDIQTYVNKVDEIILGKKSLYK